ncbi:MAG TPA: phage head closure protein [Mycobacterium sp.]
MEAGKLNRRVTIQRPATGEYPDGQPMTGFVDLATVWANVRYLNGVETVKAGAVTSVAKASIRIRRRTDVTANMQVVLGATTFVIRAVLPDEESRERVDLACEVLS